MLEHASFLILSVMAIGLAFDFVNGFHDASNSIATIVATRVLKPRQAVLWASFFNVAAMLLFGTGVAKMVGSGLVSLDAITPTVVLCGLAGATLWGIITWRLGVPVSSSHALLGGYVGAAMAHSGMINGWENFDHPVIATGWIKVIMFIIIAPVMGGALSVFFIKLLMFLQRRFSFAPSEKSYKKIQLASSAFLSLMHGGNDAQKTAGIITSALVSGGVLSEFAVPVWVLALSYGMMGLGTLFGGWRIVRTMGMRLTQLDARGGVCAESASALSIMVATLCGLPVSTTHVTTGAILGVGVATNPRKVGWKVGRRIAWSWILTIPAAALVGAALMVLIDKSGG